MKRVRRGAMAKTGATGPHWHIVLGEKKQNPGGSSDYTMTSKTPQPVFKGNGSSIMKPNTTNKYASTNAWGTGTTQTPVSSTLASYATGGGATSVASGGKSLFNQAAASDD